MCASVRMEARTIRTVIPPKTIESRLLQTCVGGSRGAGSRDHPGVDHEAVLADLVPDRLDVEDNRETHAVGTGGFRTALLRKTDLAPTAG